MLNFLAKNKRWNACINRLYYSCFYAVSSLLLTKNINTSTHKGIRLKFNELFIKTEIIPKEQGRLYSKLFEWRQKGDYGDLFDFDEKRIEPLIEPVKMLIEKIETLL